MATTISDGEQPKEALEALVIKGSLKQVLSASSTPPPKRYT